MTALAIPTSLDSDAEGVFMQQMCLIGCSATSVLHKVCSYTKAMWSLLFCTSPDGVLTSGYILEDTWQFIFSNTLELLAQLLMCFLHGTVNNAYTFASIPVVANLHWWASAHRAQLCVCMLQSLLSLYTLEEQSKDSPRTAVRLLQAEE